MIKSGSSFDVAVVGGGIMGCATALNLARGGMKTVLVERRGLCMEASGVNAGTLTHKAGPDFLQSYYTRSIALWKTTADWLHADVGFCERGGLTLAFGEAEAARLSAGFERLRNLEVEIELVGGNRARQLEPNLSERVTHAYYFPRDAYVNSYKVGYGYQRALVRSGVTVLTQTDVERIDDTGGGFTIGISGQVIRAGRVVISAGAWVRKLLGTLGLDFTETLTCRVNMMGVTERIPSLFKLVITHVNGGLSLKQPDNGTVIIGGGWQGLGSPRIGGVEIIRENLLTNLRLTHSAFPSIANARLVRTWLGIESRLVSARPYAGAIPRLEGAFVVGGFQSGFTAGPYVGRLLADLVLGNKLEQPLFDPAQVIGPKPEGFLSRATGQHNLGDQSAK
jgi:sarcosine oxidase subunit beta